MRKDRITLKDIAEASGVDVSTVSRSLNGSYGIHRSTRQKVLAIAAELNYRPNRVARGLATGRSHTIGLIVSDIRNPFFAEVTRGAEDVACASGCDVVLCNSDLNPDKQMRYVQSLVDKRVDGILMNSAVGLDRAQQEQLAASGIPIVLLNRTRSVSNFSTVTADNFEGGALAGNYLVKLGHRRVAHLTGPRDNGNLRERLRGFQRATAALSDAPLVMHGDQTYQGAYEMTRTLIARHPEITAISAANDAMAFGVMRALIEARIEIPRDVSVIGFDNVEMSCISHPPLTTVHQPKYEMGRAAVEMLLRFAERPEAPLPEHRVLGVKLVERQSCAAPVRAMTAAG